MRFRSWVLIAVAMVVLFVAPAIAGAVAIPPAPYETAEACLACHDVDNGGPVVSTVQFDVGAVDRDTACRKCHWPATGIHPFHNTTTPCGSCHSGWGAVQPNAVPATDLIGGSFFNASSRDVDAATLHQIHSTPRWPASASIRAGQLVVGVPAASTSYCGSCHAAAACSACHEAPIPHGDHTYDPDTGTRLAAPWSGTVGSGTPEGDQSVNTARIEQVTCSASTCHAPATVGTPTSYDSGAATVVKTGVWSFSYNASYIGGSALYTTSRTAGSHSVSAVVSGGEFAVLGFLSPSGGFGFVKVDGVTVGTINYFGSSTGSVQLFRASLPPGAHTVEVVNSGLSGDGGGALVTFDAFLVYPAATAFVPSCLSCHADREGAHGYDTVDHVATSAIEDFGGDQCSDCHAMDLMTEHGKTTSAGSRDCTVCHPTPRDTIVGTDGNPGPWNQSCAQGGCHAAPNAKHAGVASAHSTATVPVRARECAGCHGQDGDLAAIHTEATTTVEPGGAVRRACLVCHNATSLPTNDCVSCHFTMNDHPSADHVSAFDMRECDGSGCHASVTVGASGETTEDLVAIHGDFRTFACGECHTSAKQSVKDAIAAGDKACTACHDNPGNHQAVHPLSPALVDASGPHYAYGTGSAPGGVYTEECKWCHTDNLVDEHLGTNGRPKRYNPDGSTIGCSDCHQSTDLKVQLAILNGSAPTHDYAACDDCHTAASGTPVHLQMAEVHESGYLGVAGQGMADLTVVHDYDMTVTPPGGTPLSGCVLCHNYFTKYDTPADPMGTRTQDAISTGKTGCGECHTVARMDARHAAPDSASCKGCHTKSVTELHAKSKLGACAVCHANATRGNLVLNKTDADCQQSGCHATEGTDFHTRMDAAHLTPTAGTCWGSGCHDTSRDLRTVHALYVGEGAQYSQYATTCDLCHRNTDPSRIDWSRTYGACSDCHGIFTHSEYNTKHATTAASDPCTPCHGTNLSAAHKTDPGAPPPTGCDKCHASKTNYAKTADCTSCHAPKFPPADNHYSDTTHTASPFTAAYQGASFAAGGEECAKCHSAVLPAAHASTTASGGSVTCVECHTNTSLNSKAVVAANWGAKKCADCHDYPSDTSKKTHAQYGSAHVVAANGCGGSGSGCHESTDLAVLHAKSQSGGNTRYASCYNADPTDPTSCHNVKDKRPSAVNAADSCGTGSGGCHEDKGPGTHGAHTLDVTGSDYSNATVTGCTNSGAGCHLTETRAQASYENPYHPDKGCATSACHTSSSMASKDNPLACQDCHDGSYAKAPNVKTLTALTSAGGHYSETTHTAAATDRAGTVSSGGTVSAKCTDCHDDTPASGLKGIYAQHQDLGATYGDTTCGDCHSYNEAVAGVVKSGWANGRCADCHKTGVMTGKEQHATTSPVVNGSSSAGCANSGANCHDTADLHALHKGRTGGKVTTCALADCHDAAHAGIKPTAKTCGTGGACHGTVSTANHGAHTLDKTASAYSNTTIAGCTNSGAGCHGSESRTTASYENPYHPDNGCGASACHKSASFASHVGPQSCQGCHDGTYADAPNVKTLTSSAAGGHYPEATHTVVAADLNGTVGAGGTVTAKCTDCHPNAPASGLRQLYAQHQNVATSTKVPSGDVTCVDCHSYNAAVSRVATATVGLVSCGACHNGTAMPNHAQHASTAPAVSATSVDGCGGSGVGCHSSNDLHALHKGKTGGRVNSCALANCHDAAHSGIKPTAKSCGTGGSCHSTYAASHYSVTLHTARQADTTGTVSSGGTVTARCIDCHDDAVTGSKDGLLAQHKSLPAPYGDVGCGKCHNYNAGVTAEVVASWTNQACVDCHNATDMPGLAQHALTAPAVNGSSPDGCTSCHSSELHALHKGKTGGKVTTCALTGCHDYSKQGLKPSGKTCGSGGACHSAGDPHKPHLPLNSNSCLASGCHDKAPDGTAAPGGDLMVLHKGRTEGKCDVCHNNPNKTTPDLTAGKTTFDCAQSGCHGDVTGDHKAQHTAAGIEGCGGCHYTNLVDEHGKLGVECSACHDSTNASVRAAITAHDLACSGCHPAVNGKNRHRNQDTNEFVAANSAVHRVDTALPGMRTSFLVNGRTYTWSLPTNSWLKTGWTTSSIVTCDKCHTFAAPATGPHGASVAVNIDPAYPQNWQSARINGSSYNDYNGTQGTVYTGGYQGTSTGSLICNKCHQNYTSMNGVHGEGDHDGALCVDCHTQMPHGWKMPRMLAYKTDPEPYNSLRLTGLALRSYSPNGNWDESDCAASCDDHSGTMSSKWPSAGQAVATIGGRVMDSAEATRIAGAVVSLSNGWKTTSNSAGYYTFEAVPGGAYTVSVVATGFVGQSAGLTVAQSDDYFADFNLLRQGTLGGIVADSVTGAPVSDVTVSLNTGVTRTSGADGGFSFGSLPAGAYTLTFTKSGYVAGSKQVTVVDGVAGDGSIALVKISYASVGGVVTDKSNGTGIQGASVSLGSGLSATTDANGRYTIANVVYGTYTMTVTAAGYDTTSLPTVVEGPDVKIDVQLSKPNTVNIAKGKPATASNSVSGYGAANAVDGNTSTYWNSGSVSSTARWLRVDLGTAPAMYNKFVINWNGNYYARNVEVQTSLDGATWDTVASTSSGTGGAAQTFTLERGQTARFVRLYLSNYNTSSGYRIDEFEVWTGGMAPSANAARTGTFSASGSNSSYPPSRAGDGRYTTYWLSNSLSSSNPARWLQVDLGSDKEIAKAVVGWNGTSYYARSYEVQYADSASGPWTTVTNGSVSNSYSSSNRTFTFEPVRARYWRVNCTAYATSSGYLISEFEVWTP